MSNDPNEPTALATDHNPYAPPQAPNGGPGPVDAPSDIAEAEAIRRKYLNHEASVKSIGSLHYIGAVLAVLGLGIIPSRYLFGLRQIAARNLSSLFAGLVVNFLVSAVINLVLGIGLTGLKPWARWTEVVLATILLLIYLLATMGGIATLTNDPTAGPMIAGIVVMSIILIYVLYLLLSKKGSMVFTPGYRLIIERTPHIKYNTSWIVKGCLILIVLLIVFAIIGALVSSRR